MRSEREIQDMVRVEASQAGARLWRNNLGAGTLVNGSFIRWGLANESSAMNAILKSADLIGVRPVVITQEMVGTTVGVFLSREIKPEGWKFTGTPHEIAQRTWIDLINSMGGDAAFASSVGTIGRHDEPADRKGNSS